MIEIKRIKELWPRLTNCQTLLIALRARWLVSSEAYVQLPYTFRRRLFDWSLYAFIPAHWVR